MLDYAGEGRPDRGIQVIIAGAAVRPIYPALWASATPGPVIGVPVGAAGWTFWTRWLSHRADAVRGFAVATVSIGGARNGRGLLRCAYWRLFGFRPAGGSRIVRLSRSWPEVGAGQGCGGGGR